MLNVSKPGRASPEISANILDNSYWACSIFKATEPLDLAFKLTSVGVLEAFIQKTEVQIRSISYKNL